MQKKLIKLVNVFYNDLVAVEKIKTELFLDKPLDAGSSIFFLDLSKWFL